MSGVTGRERGTGWLYQDVLSAGRRRQKCVLVCYSDSLASSRPSRRLFAATVHQSIDAIDRKSVPIYHLLPWRRPITSSPCRPRQGRQIFTSSIPMNPLRLPVIIATSSNIYRRVSGRDIIASVPYFNRFRTSGNTSTKSNANPRSWPFRDTVKEIAEHFRLAEICRSA